MYKIILVLDLRIVFIVFRVAHSGNNNYDVQTVCNIPANFKVLDSMYHAFPPMLNLHNLFYTCAATHATCNESHRYNNCIACARIYLLILITIVYSFYSFSHGVYI